MRFQALAFLALTCAVIGPAPAFARECIFPANTLLCYVSHEAQGVRKERFLQVGSRISIQFSFIVPAEYGREVIISLGGSSGILSIGTRRIQLAPGPERHGGATFVMPAWLGDPFSSASITHIHFELRKTQGWGDRVLGTLSIPVNYKVGDWTPRVRPQLVEPQGDCLEIGDRLYVDVGYQAAEDVMLFLVPRYQGRISEGDVSAGTQGPLPAGIGTARPFFYLIEDGALVDSYEVGMFSDESGTLLLLESHALPFQIRYARDCGPVQVPDLSLIGVVLLVVGIVLLGVLRGRASL